MSRTSRRTLNRLLVITSALCLIPCHAMAIQDDQAITALLQQGTNNAQPGKVTLGPGVWTINATIEIDSGGVIIEGEGETILKASALLGSDPIFHIPNNTTSTHRTNVTFRSLWFQGLDGTLEATTDATGIKIGSGTGGNGTVRNIVVKECRFGSEDGYLANGIHQDGRHIGLGISDSQFEYSDSGLKLQNDGHEFLIDRSRFAYNNHGIYAGADTIGQRPEGLRVHKSVFIDNKFGIYAVNLVWGVLSGTDFDYGQTADGVGIYSESWYNVRVESCEFIGGADPDIGFRAIWINGEIVRSRFLNNDFGHSTERTISIDGPGSHVDVSFVANWFPSINPLYVAGARRLQITKNNFVNYEDAGTAAVVVESEDVVITDNSVLSYDQGFRIRDSDRVVVANNIIRGIEYHGISFIEDLGDRPAIYTTSSNVVLQSGSGLYFEGTNTLRSVIVNGNNFADNDYGILSLPTNAVSSANILP